MIYRYRFVWVAVVLLVTAGAIVLFTGRPGEEPADLPEQLATRMRATLEQADPGRHHHAGHEVAQAKGVICGVRVYGYEPAGVTALAEVRTVYGFHFCGVAEQARPWDVAVKLAGPVILDLAKEPPGIQVVEATADVKFADRLREMFPPEYAELARTQTLTDQEMADLRRRYDDAAGL